MSHRFDLINEIIKKGYAVDVITSFDKNDKLPNVRGLEFKFLDSGRANFGIFKLFKTTVALRRLIMAQAPCFIYGISHRSILLSVFASIFTESKLLLAISGMGSLFSAKSDSFLRNFKYRVIRAALLSFYKYSIPKKRSYFILQNQEDLEFLSQKNISSRESSFLIPGNGLPKSFFLNDPLKRGIPFIKFIMIGRLLKDKGVLEYLRASHELSLEFDCFESSLHGSYDLTNFNCLKPEDINPYLNERVRYKGHSKNIQQEIINSTFVVHPSYREGFSRVLMESQACSRPVITSNVVGCRDVILPGKTGLLVEPGDMQGLKDAMKAVIQKQINLTQFSINAHKHATNNFTVEVAADRHIRIFDKIHSKN